MMMALGDFVFELRGAAYQDFRRQTEWRHAVHSRVGRRPASQYVGPGSDSITLSGTLLPELTGGRATLDRLREMGDQGKAWPLVEGNGRIYGLWTVQSVSEISTVFFRDGVPRKIEFALSLHRVDDDRIDPVGSMP
jgi:phage protein U